MTAHALMRQVEHTIDKDERFSEVSEMKLENKTYNIELTAEELEVLNNALTLAYNTLFLRVNPSYADEQHLGFYTDAVEHPLQWLIGENKIGELKKMTHLIQNESGLSQSW